MREQEVRELYEAYRQVHQPQEKVEQLDENVQDTVKGALEKGAKFMKKNPVGKAVSAVIAPVGSGRNTPTATSGGYRPEEVEIDLFDTILEHLVAEGYADTNEAALAIMANMSEEWRQSIVENRGMAYSGGKPGASGDGSKPKGITGGKTYQMPGFDDDSTKKPKLKGV
jgi:hypothetical protein